MSCTCTVACVSAKALESSQQCDKPDATPAPIPCFTPARPAGQKATYTITVTNIGAVRLKSLALAVPTDTVVTACTPATHAWPGPWTVEPYKTLVCTAEYLFNQTKYEAGAFDFQATATSTELPSPGVTSAAARITPTYSPGLQVTKGTCVLPTTARKWDVLPSPESTQQWHSCAASRHPCLRFCVCLSASMASSLLCFATCAQQLA